MKQDWPDRLYALRGGPNPGYLEAALAVVEDTAQRHGFEVREYVPVPEVPPELDADDARRTEIEERGIVISFEGGPFDEEIGFARDCRPIQFGRGTYRFIEWGTEGDAVFEWGPTRYVDHDEGGK